MKMESKPMKKRHGRFYRILHPDKFISFIHSGEFFSFVIGILAGFLVFPCTLTLIGCFYNNNNKYYDESFGIYLYSFPKDNREKIVLDQSEFDYIAFFPDIDDDLTDIDVFENRLETYVDNNYTGDDIKNFSGHLNVITNELSFKYEEDGNLEYKFVFINIFPVNVSEMQYYEDWSVILNGENEIMLTPIWSDPITVNIQGSKVSNVSITGNFKITVVLDGEFFEKEWVHLEKYNGYNGPYFSVSFNETVFHRDLTLMYEDGYELEDSQRDNVTENYHSYGIDSEYYNAYISDLRPGTVITSIRFMYRNEIIVDWMDFKII